MFTLLLYWTLLYIFLPRTIKCGLHYQEKRNPINIFKEKERYVLSSKFGLVLLYLYPSHSFHGILWSCDNSVLRAKETGKNKA